MVNFVAKKCYERVGTYYHCFPEYSQGRKVLWDGIDAQGKRFLDAFPRPLVAGTNSQEMKLTLSNGSIYQIVGADNYDSVVGSNPVGFVFDEWALSDKYPIAWDYFRPILAENGGWAVFAFCVAPETITVTEGGPMRMGTIAEGRPHGFSSIDMSVYGLNGLHQATDFFRNGKGPTITITTSYGYALTCTPNHPVWTSRGWCRADSLREGDLLPIQRGMQQWGQENVAYTATCSHRHDQEFTVNQRMAYILGLWLAEGSINGANNIVITTKFDRDINDTLSRFGFKRYDAVHYIKSSKQFVQFFDWLGMPRGARNKRISDKLLSLPKAAIASLLRGYFDGDGCATKRGTIHCDSVSEGLINDIQTLLLNFGIISCKRQYIVRPTKKVKVSSKIFRLEITGYNAHLFYEQIGFKMQRKNVRKKFIKESSKQGYGDFVQWPEGFDKETYLKGMNATDLKRHDRLTYRMLAHLLRKKANSTLQKIYDDHFFYDRIVSITQGESYTCDFVIPDTHSFFTNGLISHNTPRGMNHGYTLHEMARRDPSWFCQLLTVDDTGVISHEDIEAERRAGMSDDMIAQEFYCSFTVVGSRPFQFTPLHHVVDPRPVPPWAPVYMAMDWGFGAPFAVVWVWIDNDGRAWQCGEWYGWNGKPNVGLRMPDTDIALGILERESAMGINSAQVVRLAGPDCFQRKPNYMGGGQGPSTAEYFSNVGVDLSPGDPSRELKLRQFRERLRVPDDGSLPMLVVYRTCEQTIRTLPLLSTDPKRIEDVLTTGEDHLYDALCHVCMSRPIGPDPVRVPKMPSDARIDFLESAAMNSYDEREITYVERDRARIMEDRAFDGWDDDEWTTTVPRGGGVE